nr:extracellular solute-binding protein [Streptomyces sp. NBC_00886]
MNGYRRRHGLLAGALVIGLTASACANGDDSAQSGKVADTSGTAPTGVALTLWHNTADPTALLDLYKSYEKESGNTIKLVDIPADSFPSTVQTKWATGARPDILEWHGNQVDVLSLNAGKNMIDLSALSFVKKEGTLADVSGNVSGKVYAATVGSLSVDGIFYNKQVFTRAGLQPPQTYGELASDCKTLRRFWSVKLPLLAPAVTFNVVVSLVGAFSALDVVFSTTAGGPGDATTLLNVAVYTQYGQSFFGTASALSFVVTLMVIVTAVPLMSWLRRREVPM